MGSFDIVIPLGPNEISRIHDQIQYTKKNVIGYRNIYIVTCNLDIQLEDCIIIDENIFLFKEYIKRQFNKDANCQKRVGWYYQQLIKLHSGQYITDILDNYLVIDADVFFLKPLIFMENDKPIFSTGNEYHTPYFEHMDVLHSSFTKVYPNSGICHHMLFNKGKLQEMFTIAEEYHHKPFWQIFIDSVSPIHQPHSGASEYELYFNYMVKNYKNNIIIRDLCWNNISSNNVNLQKISENSENYDYVSICSWF